MPSGSLPAPFATAVAVVAVTLALAQAVLYGVRRRRRAKRIAWRSLRAVRGEERAPAWLSSHGYTVLGAQVVTDHSVCLNSQVVTVGLRADYMAEKNGERFVVEVKTGSLAPKLETSATRRQLLEYLVAFDVDGVLLVDAEQGTVHQVTFPSLGRWPLMGQLERSARVGDSQSLAALIALGVAVAIFCCFWAVGG